MVELDLAPLVADQASVQMSKVSNYPYVDFDLSFEVAMDAAAGDLVTVTTASSDLVESAEVFDDYRSEQGERAVAIRYRLRAADRTLDADEISQQRQKMIDAAGAGGAKLRGAS